MEEAEKAAELKNARFMASRSNSKGKGKMGKGSKQGESRYSIKAVKEWTTWVMKKMKKVTHYGFIPFIIIICMNLEPKLSIAQLIFFDFLYFRTHAT